MVHQFSHIIYTNSVMPSLRKEDPLVLAFTTIRKIFKLRCRITQTQHFVLFYCSYFANFSALAVFSNFQLVMSDEVNMKFW